MTEMIKKPDANPILLAVLNLFFFGCVGYFMMGQTKKAIASIVITLVGSFCLFGLGYFWVLIAAYDAYLLGQRLQAGEAITPNTNGLSFLDAIFKD